MFLDYEVFKSTDGDIEASRQAAYHTCMTYLVKGSHFNIARETRMIARLPAKIWRQIKRSVIGDS